MPKVYDRAYFEKWYRHPRHAVGSKQEASAAIRVRQPSVSNPTIGATALRPSRRALTKAACAVPNAETTPRPETPMRGCTTAVRYHEP